MSKRKEYDVICVGAGLVGRLLCVGLAQKGFKVACVDKVGYDPSAIEKQDGRTTSISLGSKKIIEGLDLWDMIAPHAQPILNIRVFENKSPWVLNYDAEDLGDQPMGYIVENKYIYSAFFSEACVECQQGEGKIDLLAPSSYKKINHTLSYIELTLEDDTVLKAALLIAADGKNSTVRSQTKIGVTSKDYNQNALVVHIAHEKPHQDTAYEVFMPEGPLAVLPMKNQTENARRLMHRCGIVWCRNKNYDFKHVDDQTLKNEFLEYFPYLGDIEFVSSRWIFPLSYTKVTSMVDGRIILAGDAGHSMHPIAGQGVNLGWRDADTIINLLSRAKQCGLDIGSAHTLKEYDQSRKCDRLSLLWVTDSINALYQNQFLPLKFARNAAFALLNGAKPLKRTIMKRAMGLL